MKPLLLRLFNISPKSKARRRKNKFTKMVECKIKVGGTELKVLLGRYPNGDLSLYTIHERT